MLDALKEFFNIPSKLGLYLSEKVAMLYIIDAKWSTNIMDRKVPTSKPKNINQKRVIMDRIRLAQLCQIIHRCRCIDIS